MSIVVKKNETFMLNGIKLVLHEDQEIHKDDRGFSILNMWDQCDIEDLNILPAAYVVCANGQEEYELSKFNVVLGGAKDICLN